MRAENSDDPIKICRHHDGKTVRAGLPRASSVRSGRHFYHCHHQHRHAHHHHCARQRSRHARQRPTDMKTCLGNRLKQRTPKFSGRRPMTSSNTMGGFCARSRWWNRALSARCA
eukprot:6994386-Karenia_brevis.AAC.1